MSPEKTSDFKRNPYDIQNQVEVTPIQLNHDNKASFDLHRTNPLLGSRKLTDLQLGVRNIVINADEPAERFKARTD